MKTWTADTITACIDARRAGWPLREISDAYGPSMSSISGWHRAWLRASASGRPYGWYRGVAS